MLLLSISFTTASCGKENEFPDAEHSVNKRFGQSMVWNSTNLNKEIVVNTDHYLILFTGDSHVGGIKNLTTLLRIARNSNAVAVTMAGDLIDGNPKDYAKLSQCLQTQDSVPYFLTVGNHDLWFNNGWDEYFIRFGASTYTFTIKTPTGNDLYISLDSGSGTLGTDQLKWFENTLQNQRLYYRRCIVFTHLNFFRFRFSEISNPLVEELNKLIELFTRYHVDMLISGHEHRRYTQVFGLTTYIVMEPLKDGVYNAGYLKLNVDKGELNYSYERFN
ncbi:MAG TPA: hypothetical protein DDW27_10050 [Bacteroidales bacterium]|nr:hypothetical protein [Bacteroidales bacterium]